jgi:predicted AAA+ superfamily ATPase
MFMPSVSRSKHLSTLRLLLEQFPVVAMIGPRQAGKTTLSDKGLHHFEDL